MPIRPFRQDDIAGVNALHTDIRWSSRSTDQWQWLMDNPARQASLSPVGWVLENEGRIDGFIGNFHLHYFRGTVRYTGATAYSVIVSPRAKGSIRALAAPFLQQEDVFAVSILNANHLGAPVYLRLGLTPFPEKTHALKLTWIISPIQTFISHFLRDLNDSLPRLARALGERFTPTRSIFFDARQVSWPSSVHVLEDLSDHSAYARFWDELKAQPGLTVDRSPEIMRWRMAQPGLAIAPILIGYYEADSLVAYALAQLSKTGPLDVSALEIIDLVTLDRASTDAAPQLVHALKKAARRMGAAKVRLPLLSEGLKSRLAPVRLTARREGGWGHAFVHFHAAPSDFADWHPTGFDGSYSFSLRQPVLRARSKRLLASSKTEKLSPASAG